MAKRFAGPGSITVHDENQQGHSFGPDDDLPDWAEAQLADAEHVELVDAGASAPVLGKSPEPTSASTSDDEPELEDEPEFADLNAAELRVYIAEHPEALDEIESWERARDKARSTVLEAIERARDN